MRIMKGTSFKGPIKPHHPYAGRGEGVRLEFGRYDPPVTIEQDGLKLEFTSSAMTIEYRRDLSGDTVEKVLLTDRCSIFLTPVEPVNLPRNITSHLLVEFDRPTMVPPGESRMVYGTLPVEFGVFASRGERTELLDVFSLVTPKYTLYGAPNDGHICRHWKTVLSPETPSTNPLRESIMEINLKNATPGWTELRYAVFNVHSMKILYAPDRSLVRASVRVTRPGMVETDFVETASGEGMTLAPEIFRMRKTAVMSKKFVMEGQL